MKLQDVISDDVNTKSVKDKTKNMSFMATARRLYDKFKM